MSDPAPSVEPLPLTSAWNITSHVKQQAAGRRRYVKHSGEVCSTCLTNPPRPRQRNCAQCHADAQRTKSSYKRQQTIADLHSLIAALTGVERSARLLIRRNARRCCIDTLIKNTAAKIARLEETERRLAASHTEGQHP